MTRGCECWAPRLVRMTAADGDLERPVGTLIRCRSRAMTAALQAADEPKASQNCFRKSHIACASNLGMVCPPSNAQKVTGYPGSHPS